MLQDGIGNSAGGYFTTDGEAVPAMEEAPRATTVQGSPSTPQSPSRSFARTRAVEFLDAGTVNFRAKLVTIGDADPGQFLAPCAYLGCPGVGSLSQLLFLPWEHHLYNKTSALSGSNISQHGPQDESAPHLERHVHVIMYLHLYLPLLLPLYLSAYIHSHVTLLFS